VKLTYNHVADAMYIKLTDNLVITTKPINESVLLDLDEDDQLVGIEVLHVRVSGIDPLSVAMTYYTEDHQPTPPDFKEIEARQTEIADIRKRKKQKALRQSN